MTTTLLFFDISSGEIFIILIIAFLVFGPSKFPDLARKLGKGINEIRRASDSIKKEITQEANKVEKSVKVEDTQETKTDKTEKTDSNPPGK